MAVISQRVLQHIREPTKSVCSQPKHASDYTPYILATFGYIDLLMFIQTRASRAGLCVMNSFVNDVFERIVPEASQLAQYTKHSIITSRELQNAVRLLLPRELAKHAMSEGTKTVTKYTSSK
ncbi:late histone H2B.L4-like [Xyrauchen texanus]|uniref:late histone H2B.L4-like n=1 Tax=Xyrauchen texanus TaxID=154827 RepID=UPI002241ECE1|nr:late histone H2B.L4-like [Xyrauchen texanus]